MLALSTFYTKTTAPYKFNLKHRCKSFNHLHRPLDEIPSCGNKHSCCEDLKAIIL